MKIPKSIYTIKSNITFVVCLVAFVMLFAITYTPTYGLAEEADDLTVGAKAVTLWYDHQGLCLSICCAIILGTVAISRTLLLLTTRNARIHEGEYFLWQLAEVAVTGLFCNLFLSLYFHFAYFHLMPLTLLIYISVPFSPTPSTGSSSSALTATCASPQHSGPSWSCATATTRSAATPCALWTTKGT